MSDEPQNLGLAMLNHAIQRADRAEAALERVRALHQRHDCTTHIHPTTPEPCVNYGTCLGCGAPEGSPCRTIQAIDGEAET